LKGSEEIDLEEIIPPATEKISPCKEATRSGIGYFEEEEIPRKVKK
jgi:hypothetical protein